MKQQNKTEQQVTHEKLKGTTGIIQHETRDFNRRDHWGFFTMSTI